MPNLGPNPGPNPEPNPEPNLGPNLGPNPAEPAPRPRLGDARRGAGGGPRRGLCPPAVRLPARLARLRGDPVAGRSRRRRPTAALGLLARLAGRPRLFRGVDLVGGRGLLRRRPRPGLDGAVRGGVPGRRPGAVLGRGGGALPRARDAEPTAPAGVRRRLRR